MARCQGIRAYLWSEHNVDGNTARYEHLACFGGDLF
jgi:hypothetical protein